MTAAFITFEGGEGSGKTTQARRLAETLRQGGREVVLTREPGGSPGAELLRDMLLFGQHDFAPLAEVMLHFAARAEHLARTIEPALARGAVVISDRFFDSTTAYQVHGNGAPAAAVAGLRRIIGRDPDLTVILRVTPEVAAARVAARAAASDRYQARDGAFHARVQQGFLTIASAEPQRCLVVDADGSPDAVADAIRNGLRARLGLNLAG